MPVILLAYARRIVHLLKVVTSDIVFIHREAAPFGPPIFEWIIVNLLRKKVIYDFDDAIWLTDKVSETKMERRLRFRGKVASICRWSWRVSCGNEYLSGYARKFNSDVICNPTTIDTAYHDPALQAKPDRQVVTIGWTGSHSTLKYLTQVELVLQRLERQYPHMRFRVIADQKPLLKVESMEFILWQEKSEVDDLMAIDIGIMPLPDDEWSRGKCGFKALQYLSLEIPCVASPVGVNKNIIKHGTTGFLADTSEEWYLCLKKLIDDPELRAELGRAGRKQIIHNYSTASNESTFLSLFE